MISLSSTGGSPFLILWYVFLVFLGAVLGAHVLFRIIASLLKKKTDSIFRTGLKGSEK